MRSPILVPEIDFTVPLDPVPWQRPRFNNGRGFTASEVRRFELAFIAAAKPHQPITPMTGDLAVCLSFYIRRKKSVKRPRPGVRPDLGNYAKVIEDVMNGRFYLDDGQIVASYAQKLYADTGSINVQIARVA